MCVRYVLYLTNCNVKNLDSQVEENMEIIRRLNLLH